tara:strand:- start:5080 stop:5646 length:567 start_codon:yes stop_codon:yes gene_type:complete
LKIYIITGPIGSGKTEVQKILDNLGFECYCADTMVQKIYSREEIISEMNKIFPEYVSNNSIDLEIIRNHIFDDSKKRIELEKYMQPKVFEEFNNIIEESKSETIFFVLPIIEKNDFSRKYKSIYIEADEEIRLQRIMKRKKYNIQLSKKIIKLQNSIDNNKDNSDYYIKNNDSFLKLKKSVMELITKL